MRLNKPLLVNPSNVDLFLEDIKGAKNILGQVYVSRAID